MSHLGPRVVLPPPWAPGADQQFEDQLGLEEPRQPGPSWLNQGHDTLPTVVEPPARCLGAQGGCSGNGNIPAAFRSKLSQGATTWSSDPSGSSHQIYKDV